MTRLPYTLSIFSACREVPLTSSLPLTITSIRSSVRKGRLPARPACFVCIGCGGCAVGTIRYTLHQNQKGVYLDSYFRLAGLPMER